MVGRPEDEFTSERHVYEPHKIGLPPLGPYVHELWRRREFAREMARTNLRAQHFNTAFPRVLLPLSDVLTAFTRFLPTIAIYLPAHFLAGLPVGLVDLWVFPLFALLTILASGAAMLVAALQVYFRDLKNFLPYFLRVWLYMSPVLYYAHEVPHGWNWLIDANPLGGLLTAWSDVINRGVPPEPWALALAVGWAFGIFIFGSLFFVSREREFAVRL